MYTYFIFTELKKEKEEEEEEYERKQKDNTDNTWWSLRTGLCRRYQTVGPVGTHRWPDSRGRHSANGSRANADL